MSPELWHIANRLSTRSKKRSASRTDWPALKMLFATGKTYKDLQEQTGLPLGTLTARGSRDNWDAARKQVQQVADEQLATVQRGLISKTERGEKWQERVENQAIKTLSVLEKQVPTDTKSAGLFIDVLDKTDKVGRRSLGLESESEGSKTIVNLGILQSAVLPTPEPAVLEAEIVRELSEDSQST